MTYKITYKDLTSKIKELQENVSETVSKIDESLKAYDLEAAGIIEYAFLIKALRYLREITNVAQDDIGEDGVLESPFNAEEFYFLVMNMHNVIDNILVNVVSKEFPRYFI